MTKVISGGGKLYTFALYFVNNTRNINDKTY